MRTTLADRIEDARIDAQSAREYLAAHYAQIISSLRATASSLEAESLWVAAEDDTPGYGGTTPFEHAIQNSVNRLSWMNANLNLDNLVDGMRRYAKAKERFLTLSESK